MGRIYHVISNGLQVYLYEDGISDVDASANPPESQTVAEEAGRIYHIFSNGLEVEASSLEELVSRAAAIVAANAPPMAVRPTLTEADVAKIGKTWTLMFCDFPLSNTAGITKLGSSSGASDSGMMDYGEDEDLSCSICMQSFVAGNKVMELPCTTQGCYSIWHLQCIHKWLDQAHNPSCPLCRAQID